MTQRKKDESTGNKDAVINIRVSKADKQRYEEEAKRYGMSTSKYILYSVDHKAIHVVEGGTEIARAMYDLNCTLNKNEVLDNLSMNELRSALTACVNKLNHFCENLQG